jgi:hypothetical protein
MKFSLLRSPLVLLLVFLSSQTNSVRAEYADEQYAQLRNNPLLHVQVKSIPEILANLIELKRRFINGEEVDLPMVTVTTESKSFIGRVLALQPSAGKDPVLLMETREMEANNRFGGSLIAFIKMDDIEAVEIREAWSNGVQAAMGYGSFETMTTPTKLDLKRKMANFSTWVGEKSGHPVVYNLDLATVPAEGHQLRLVSAAMNEVTGELTELLQTGGAQGKKIRKELKSVTFVIGKDSEIVFKEGALTASIDLSLPENTQRRQYASKLSSVFSPHKE